MTAKGWPATRAEFDVLEARALRKYKPLVDELAPPDLIALATVVAAALDAIRPSTYSLDVRNGLRPPGTRVGR